MTSKNAMLELYHTHLIEGDTNLSLDICFSFHSDDN